MAGTISAMGSLLSPFAGATSQATQKHHTSTDVKMSSLVSSVRPGKRDPEAQMAAGAPGKANAFGNDGDGFQATVEVAHDAASEASNDSRKMIIRKKTDLVIQTNRQGEGEGRSGV
jgi:hypothetical protein